MRLFCGSFLILVIGLLTACQSGSESGSTTPSSTSNLTTTTTSTTSGGSGSTPPPTAGNRCLPVEELRQEMLSLINSARSSSRSCGGQLYDATTPVSWDNQLKSAADLHTSDMASNNFFSHTGSNGSEVWDRVQNAGYYWLAIGENISAGTDAAETVARWLQSPGHCANIMNPDFKEIGAACVNNSSSQYDVYYTLVLAAQR